MFEVLPGKSDMSELKIKKEAFTDFLKGLKDACRLYGPVRHRGMVNFRQIGNAGDMDLSFRNSLLSPKSLFLPQSEPMFAYSLDHADKDAHILKEAPRDCPDCAVIGIRPCDALALELVDVNFHTAEFKDPWWLRARAAATLVGLGCTKPCHNSFCTSVGGGPFGEKGLDILLTDTGGAFLAKVLTEKGNDLLKAASAFEPATEELVRLAASIQEESASRIASRIDTSRLATLDTLALYNADFWEDVQFSCINCGICTYLCPTCWCFDIQDETYDRLGRRVRNWDSCMFPLFTQHASGHNPRPHKIHRVRQRFMHKLKYYVDKYHNGIACVGCGRCVRHCPVNIDIRKVCAMMNDYMVS